eukprot:217785_1
MTKMQPPQSRVYHTLLVALVILILYYMSLFFYMDFDEDSYRHFKDADYERQDQKELQRLSPHDQQQNNNSYNMMNPLAQLQTMAGDVHGHKFQECKWSHSHNISRYKYQTWYDGENDKNHILGMDYLMNKANLTFMVQYGSLLGAYRHGGTIPFDRDIDLIVPVWLNINQLLQFTNISYQTCADAKYLWLHSTMNQTITNSTYYKRDTLCGLAKSKWIWAVINYLKYSMEWFNTSTDTPFPCSRCVKGWGFKWRPFRRPAIMIDVKVDIGFDPMFLTHNMSLCRCKYNSLMVLCPDDAAYQLQNYYGSRFMTIDKPGNVKRFNQRHKQDFVNYV